jgi:hypothetical protein
MPVFMSLALRRVGLFIIGGTLGGAFALLIQSSRLTPAGWLLRAVLAATLVIVSGIIGWYLWRCPRCSGHLGERLSVRRCPQCGAELRRARRVAA